MKTRLPEPSGLIVIKDQPPSVPGVRRANAIIPFEASAAAPPAAEPETTDAATANVPSERTTRLTAIRPLPPQRTTKELRPSSPPVNLPAGYLGVDDDQRRL